MYFIFCDIRVDRGFFSQRIKDDFHNLIEFPNNYEVKIDKNRVFFEDKLEKPIKMSINFQTTNLEKMVLRNGEIIFPGIEKITLKNFESINFLDYSNGFLKISVNEQREIIIDTKRKATIDFSNNITIENDQEKLYFPIDELTDLFNSNYEIILNPRNYKSIKFGDLAILLYSKEKSFIFTSDLHFSIVKLNHEIEIQRENNKIILYIDNKKTFLNIVKGGEYVCGESKVKFLSGSYEIPKNHKKNIETHLLKNSSALELKIHNQKTPLSEKDLPWNIEFENIIPPEIYLIYKDLYYKDLYIYNIKFVNFENFEKSNSILKISSLLANSKSNNYKFLLNGFPISDYSTIYSLSEDNNFFSINNPIAGLSGWFLLSGDQKILHWNSQFYSIFSNKKIPLIVRNNYLYIDSIFLGNSKDKDISIYYLEEDSIFKINNINFYLKSGWQVISKNEKSFSIQNKEIPLGIHFSNNSNLETCTINSSEVILSNNRKYSINSEFKYFVDLNFTNILMNDVSTFYGVQEEDLILYDNSSPRDFNQIDFNPIDSNPKVIIKNYFERESIYKNTIFNGDSIVLGNKIWKIPKGCHNGCPEFHIQDISYRIPSNIKIQGPINFYSKKSDHQSNVFQTKVHQFDVSQTEIHQIFLENKTINIHGFSSNNSNLFLNNFQNNFQNNFVVSRNQESSSLIISSDPKISCHIFCNSLKHLVPLIFPNISILENDQINDLKIDDLTILEEMGNYVMIKNLNFPKGIKIHNYRNLKNIAIYRNKISLSSSNSIYSIEEDGVEFFNTNEFPLSLNNVPITLQFQNKNTIIKILKNNAIGESIVFENCNLEDPRSKDPRSNFQSGSLESSSLESSSENLFRDLNLEIREDGFFSLNKLSGVFRFLDLNNIRNNTKNTLKYNRNGDNLEIFCFRKFKESKELKELKELNEFLPLGVITLWNFFDEKESSIYEKVEILEENCFIKLKENEKIYSFSILEDISFIPGNCDSFQKFKCNIPIILNNNRFQILNCNFTLQTQGEILINVLEKDIEITIDSKKITFRNYGSLEHFILKKDYILTDNGRISMDSDNFIYYGENSFRNNCPAILLFSNILQIVSTEEKCKIFGMNLNNLDSLNLDNLIISKDGFFDSFGKIEGEYFSDLFTTNREVSKEISIKRKDKNCIIEQKNKRKIILQNFFKENGDRNLISYENFNLDSDLDLDLDFDSNIKENPKENDKYDLIYIPENNKEKNHNLDCNLDYNLDYNLKNNIPLIVCGNRVILNKKVTLYLRNDWNKYLEKNLKKGNFPGDNLLGSNFLGNNFLGSNFLEINFQDGKYYINNLELNLENKYYLGMNSIKNKTKDLFLFEIEGKNLKIHNISRNNIKTNSLNNSLLNNTLNVPLNNAQLDNVPLDNVVIENFENIAFGKKNYLEIFSDSIVIGSCRIYEVRNSLIIPPETQFFGLKNNFHGFLSISENLHNYKMNIYNTITKINSSITIGKTLWNSILQSKTEIITLDNIFLYFRNFQVSPLQESFSKTEIFNYSITLDLLGEQITLETSSLNF